MSSEGGVATYARSLRVGKDNLPRKEPLCEQVFVCVDIQNSYPHV